MSKKQAVSDYPDDFDWENDEDWDDRSSGKEQATFSRISRKRNVKRRLDDFFENKRLREKNRYLDDFDFDDVSYPN